MVAAVLAIFVTGHGMRSSGGFAAGAFLDAMSRLHRPLVLCSPFFLAEFAFLSETVEGRGDRLLEGGVRTADEGPVRLADDGRAALVKRESVNGFSYGTAQRVGL